MPEQSPDHDSELDSLLERWSDGDESAGEAYIAAVYGELRRLARIHFSGERPEHTLQPTSLVSEVWLKLKEANDAQWQDRTHFMALASRIMRQILVDSGRRKRAAKRQIKDPLTITVEVGDQSASVDFAELDKALTRLEALDEAQARIVELRYFGGLTVAETAEVMGLSTATVNRYWRAARSWLFMQLEPLGQ